MVAYIQIKGFFFALVILLGIKLATGKQWDNEEYAAGKKGRQTTMLKIVV